jgi:hypothetical protein
VPERSGWGGRHAPDYLSVRLELIATALEDEAASLWAIPVDARPAYLAGSCDLSELACVGEAVAGAPPCAKRGSDLRSDRGPRAPLR